MEPFKAPFDQIHWILGRINIGIEPTTHRKSLRFHLKILQSNKILKSSIGLRFDDFISENSP